MSLRPARKRDVPPAMVKLRAWLDRTETSQAKFAVELSKRRGASCSAGLVWQWLNGVRRVAGEWVLHIEDATDHAVSRHELSPDLYPRALAA